MKSIFILIGYVFAFACGAFVPDKHRFLILGIAIGLAVFSTVMALIIEAIERAEGIQNDLYESEIASAKGELSSEIEIRKEDIEAVEKAFNEAKASELETVSRQRKEQILQRMQDGRKGQMFEINK